MIIPVNQIRGQYKFTSARALRAWLMFLAVREFLVHLGTSGTLVVPNQGETIALEALVGKTAGQNLILKLFKNDVTPGQSTTEAGLTEADFTGYSAITLTAANWTATPADPSHIDYAQQTFTSTAGSQNQAVYGYYLVQVTSGKLVWAERFSDGPYTIVNSGDNIKITPVITLAAAA